MSTNYGSGPQTASESAVSDAKTTFLARFSRYDWWFFGLMALGLVLRIVFIFSSGHHLNSDQSVVYLMAKHVADGEFPAFYWGQSYGGALLQLSAGVVMLVFGAHVEVLAIVSALWFLAGAVLLRLIVAKAAGPLAGVIAAVLFWFPGFVVLEVSTGDPGFYGPSIVFALAAIAIATSAPLSRPVVAWLALGCTVGLALWMSPMGFAIAAPSVVVMAVRDRNILRWLAGAAAGIVASLPWTLEALGNAQATKPLGVVAHVVNFDSFGSLFDKMLPAAFPLNEWGVLSNAYQYGAIILLVGLLVVGIVARKPAFIVLATGTVACVVVLVYGAGVELTAESVRYTSFLVPALAASSAWLLTRWSPLAWIAMLVAPALTISLVYVKSDGVNFDTSMRFDGNYVALEEMLTEHDVTHAYGSYWMSYSMTAATGEEITVAPLVVRRYPAYEREAAEDGPPVIILFVDRANDIALQEATDLPRYTRETVGGFAVYFFSESFDVYERHWDLF